MVESNRRMAQPLKWKVRNLGFHSGTNIGWPISPNMLTLSPGALWRNWTSTRPRMQIIK